VNAGRAGASGLEGEVELRLPHGISTYVNHAYARARDLVQDVALSNSPRHLSKFGVQLPIGRLHLGVEGQYIGRRSTLSGDSLDGVFVPNVTLSSSGRRHMELSLSVYNAFDARYGDPAAEEHLQIAIPQDGRTVLARARFRF
jgi:iron complex outermembrane receptor protein